MFGCVCKCVDSSHVGNLCLFKECYLAAENSIKLRHLAIASLFLPSFCFLSRGSMYIIGINVPKYSV